jgi:hypothetical protein
MNLHPPAEVPSELNHSSVKEQSKDINHEIEELICLHESVDKELFKRSHSDIMMEDDFFTSNSSSCEVKNSDQA